MDNYTTTKNYWAVKLNRPLMIDITPADGELKFVTVYGFIVRRDEDVKERLRTMNEIGLYVEYLAAMHEFSSGADDFTIDDETKDWIDRDGTLHQGYDKWMDGICRRATRKLGLTYTIYRFDMNDLRKEYLDLGTRDGSIVSGALMDIIVSNAEPESQNTVILYNRPIFLPKTELWPGEDGFTHIYGVVSDFKDELKMKADSKYFLGYLAMCEEMNLNNVTPSGYTSDLAKNGELWYKDGIEYSPKDIKIREESAICRSKHNLKLCMLKTKAPSFDIEDGARDGFIVSQDLYEFLMDIAVCENRELWMSE